MAEFDVERYLAERSISGENINVLTPGMEDSDDFEALCRKIKTAFFDDWEKRKNNRMTLEIQRKAIIGYREEKAYFRKRIIELIKEADAENCTFPLWYSDLADAVYHENWGFAGMAEWFSEAYSQSSSAKIIGDRIYFMEKGSMVLKPQKISADRRNQLVKALLLLTPEERNDKDYYEIYLLDGSRVTIFLEPAAKKGQAAIIFRRYIIPNLSFEELARRGTIPYEIIPLLKVMVCLGFNVAFCGPVRSSKTTFLSTWQSYEDPSLEGVMVETDPEIPMDKLLPEAPILQLIADDEKLKKITKSLLRSDADYFILAEARDGIALDTAIRIASKGTKRMKITFHSRKPEDFPIDAATEIVKTTGGDMDITVRKVAESFDYIFSLVQLNDKSRKKLKGIYEMSWKDGRENIVPLCEFSFEKNEWRVNDIFGPDKREYAFESSPEKAYEMERIIKELSLNSPYRSD